MRLRHSSFHDNWGRQSGTDRQSLDAYRESRRTNADRRREYAEMHCELGYTYPEPEKEKR